MDSRFQRIDVGSVDAAVLDEVRALRGVSSVTRADGGARIEVDVSIRFEHPLALASRGGRNGALDYGA